MSVPWLSLHAGCRAATLPSHTTKPETGATLLCRRAKACPKALSNRKEKEASEGGKREGKKKKQNSFHENGDKYIEKSKF